VCTGDPAIRHSGNPSSSSRAARPFSRNRATASKARTHHGPRQYATTSCPRGSSSIRPINIGAYKSAVVTDYVFAPGSGFPNEAMKNDMICQMLEGEVWVKQGDKEYTGKAPLVFACGKDTFEDKNQSSAAAVMRVIDLLPR
jgi:hypothetical protein